MIHFKSLPNNKILDRSKLRAFAFDIINVTENLKFDKGRVEKIVGKAFSPFPVTFPKSSCSGLVKIGIVW